MTSWLQRLYLHRMDGGVTSDDKEGDIEIFAQVSYVTDVFYAPLLGDSC